MKQAIAFFIRYFRSILFWVRHPTSPFVEVSPLSGVKIGRYSRLDFFSRVLGGSTKAESSIVLGEHVRVGRYVEIHTWPKMNIVLGDYVSLQDACRIHGNVIIGAYSTLAPNCFVSSGGHSFRSPPEVLHKLQDRQNLLADRPVRIGEDVWLGVNVFVQAGVCIGRGAVVGANSAVLNEVEPYTIVAGNPAKIIGQRMLFVPPKKILATDVASRPYFYSGFDHFTESLQGMKIRERMAVIRLAANSASSSQLEVCFHNLGRPQKIELLVGTEKFVFRVESGQVEGKFELKNSNGPFLEVFIRAQQSGDLYVKSAHVA